jgi:hypothetical protein
MVTFPTVVIIVLLLAPLVFAARLFVANKRPYPPRGRKVGGEYTNHEAPVELNISGREFPEPSVDADRKHPPGLP